MQDWNYLAGECMELTLELSAGKSPSAAQLPQLFADNLAALLAYPLAAAFGGLRRAPASVRGGPCERQPGLLQVTFAEGCIRNQLHVRRLTEAHGRANTARGDLIS